ncbi:HIT family protein [Candidatus Woesearchaeota archaeon]|nr:HIT family protein [Candidatus Woesearchaeota archaeon]
MKDCIFCKIVKGDVAAYKLYEDDDIISFLDIFPIHPGHALVVPKKHSVDIFDTDEETMGKMMKVAKKLSPSVMKGTKANGINIGMNNRAAAGQEVLHAHVHIIPRYDDDGLKAWSKNLFKDDKHKKELYEAIKKEL